MKRLLPFIGVPVLLLAACNSNSSITLEDVHGLAYSQDGNRIMVPAHDGIKTYENGKWGASEGEKNDYMGFSPFDGGFFSSGHPAPGSDRPNPLGIVKSTDEGKTIETIGLEGMSDFHGMAVGYQSKTLYVINSEPNPIMQTPGLYYSTDEAKTWNKSEVKGFSEQPTAIAVHPTDEKTVAIGSRTGVYLSKDFGNTFSKLSDIGQVSTANFTGKGTLLIGGFSNKPYLVEINLQSKQTEEKTLPPMTDDTVAFIALHPQDGRQIAIATFKKDVFVSKDNGVNWEQISKAGSTINKE